MDGVVAAVSRSPNHRLLNRIAPGLMAATLARDAHDNLVRKAGIMAIMREGGTVKAGDPIRVELPSLPHRPLEPV